MGPAPVRVPPSYERRPRTRAGPPAGNLPPGAPGPGDLRRVPVVPSLALPHRGERPAGRGTVVVLAAQAPDGGTARRRPRGGRDRGPAGGRRRIAARAAGGGARGG